MCLDYLYFRLSPSQEKVLTNTEGTIYLAYFYIMWKNGWLATRVRQPPFWSRTYYVLLSRTLCPHFFSCTIYIYISVTKLKENCESNGEKITSFRSNNQNLFRKCIFHVCILKILFLGKDTRLHTFISNLSLMKAL